MKKILAILVLGVLSSVVQADESRINAFVKPYNAGLSVYCDKSESTILAEGGLSKVQMSAVLADLEIQISYAKTGYSFDGHGDRTNVAEFVKMVEPYLELAKLYPCSLLAVQQVYALTTQIRTAASHVMISKYQGDKELLNKFDMLGNKLLDQSTALAVIADFRNAKENVPTAAKVQ